MQFNGAVIALLLLGLISIIMNIYSNVVYDFLKKCELLPEETTVWNLKRILWWIAVPLFLLPLSYALLSLNPENASTPSPRLDPTELVKSTIANEPTIAVVEPISIVSSKADDLPASGSVSLTIGGFSSTRLEDWLWVNQNLESAVVTRDLIDRDETFRWYVTNIITSETYFTLLQKPVNRYISDFDYEVQISSSCDDANVGVSFRSNGSEYYQFTINPEMKTYRFSSYTTSNGWKDIPGNSSSEYIQKGKNIIRVIAKGDHFDILINGFPVQKDGYTWSSGSESGRAGLVVNPTKSGSCTIDYSNLTLSINKITEIK